MYVAYVSFTVYVYKVQNDQGISNSLPTSDKNFGILLILDKELNLLNNLENDLFFFWNNEVKVLSFLRNFS